MFVNNDLTKGFETKSAVKKCYHNKKKNTFSSTREILKKIEEQILSASLVCISLIYIQSLPQL